MATPSLTSSGLWYDEVTISSAKTLTLKLGVWTKITNTSSSSFDVAFTGSIFSADGSGIRTSMRAFGSGSFYVSRVS